jgi:hypothetical protein
MHLEVNQCENSKNVTIYTTLRVMCIMARQGLLWNAVCGVQDMYGSLMEHAILQHPDAMFVFMGPIHKALPPARLLSHRKCYGYC